MALAVNSTVEGGLLVTALETRAAERNVPADVLQENLGQSDPRTTARYYRAQLQRRQNEIEKAFKS